VTAWSTQQLEALVTAKTLAAGTSFYWAMRLLDPKRRLAMYAIYAFCRDVDDIVDEPGDARAKLRGLDRWSLDIAMIYQSLPPVQPLAAALQPAIAAFDLPTSIATGWRPRSAACRSECSAISARIVWCSPIIRDGRCS